MTEDQGGTPPGRRGQDRRIVIKGAKIVFNNGRGVMVCRVRDLSPGGARLEFPPRQTLPQTFELHVTGNPVRRCQLQWAKNNIAGVRFLGDNE
ncbi:MAG: PilZ domain-containing protein [Dongiaceae bacterium]